MGHGGNGHGVSPLGVEKMFRNQLEMLVAQRGECAQSHGIVPFKMVNLCFMNATSKKAKREKKKNVREARRQDASCVRPVSVGGPQQGVLLPTPWLKRS